MEPWFQIIITIFSSVLASSGLWTYLSKRTENKDVKTEMLIGLAHDRIMYLGMSYIERGYITQDEYENLKTSVYKGYKQDKIEMRGDRAEMSDFPLYLNTVAGGLDCRDQTIGGFSFVVKIYAVPVVEIIG